MITLSDKMLPVLSQKWHGRTTKTSIIWLITLLAAPFLTQNSMAQTSHYRWYQVELIAFARQPDSTQEYWPNNIHLSYPINWVELKDPDQVTQPGLPGDNSDNPAPAIDLQREPFYFLPASERKLQRYSAALKRDSRYRVLFHQAWRQFIGSKAKAPALLISGGDTYGNHSELEGSITLSVAQYLHVQTHLWFSQFEINYGQAPGDWPQLPKMPNKLRAEILADTLENNQDNQPFRQWSASNTLTSDDMLATLSEPYITQRVVVMNQERQMRSSELHYIDHPLFGLIIEITPYDVPATSSSTDTDF